MHARSSPVIPVNNKPRPSNVVIGLIRFTTFPFRWTGRFGKQLVYRSLEVICNDRLRMMPEKRSLSLIHDVLLSAGSVLSVGSAFGSNTGIQGVGYSLLWNSHQSASISPPSNEARNTLFSVLYLMLQYNTMSWDLFRGSPFETLR